MEATNVDFGRVVVGGWSKIVTWIFQNVRRTGIILIPTLVHQKGGK